ncbi:MAG: site-specific integrase [Sphingobacteriia bacterium]|nr:site-specific integrase [Sphingobacteriia bacterium]
MIAPKFYLQYKERPVTSIIMEILQFGKRYKMAVGFSVAPKFWNADKMRCRAKGDNPDAFIINEALDLYQRITIELFKSYIKELKVPTTEQFRNDVKNTIDEMNGVTKELAKDDRLLPWATKFKEEVSRADRTLIRHQTTINLLQEYQKVKKTTLRFSDIDISFYESLKRWMFSKGYSVNYFGDMVKNIKVFMNEAAERGLHENTGHQSKKFKVVSEEADTIYLNIDKLKKLFELEITPELISEHQTDQRSHNIQRRIASLVDCRDLFIIGSFTALRFSDFSTLENIKAEDEFIIKRALKTGTSTTIPMHPYIREILKRRGDTLPPPISNQKMNDALHLLCKITGFTDIINVTRTERGKLVTKAVPEYELITTHTARRSGCTNMYLAGIPIRTNMNFSGHKTLTSIMKYIKADSLEDAMKMKDHPFCKK